MRPTEGPTGIVREGRVTAGHQHPQSGRVALGGKKPQCCHRGRESAGGGWTGAGRGQKLPHHLSNRGERSQRSQRQRRGKDMRAGYGGAADPTAGNSNGQRQRRASAKAFRRRQRRQAQKQHAIAPQVRHTGAGGAGGRSSHRRSLGKRVRPQGHKGGVRTGAGGYRDRVRDQAARSPSARHAGGWRRGADPQQTAVHA